MPVPKADPPPPYPMRVCMGVHAHAQAFRMEAAVQAAQATTRRLSIAAGVAGHAMVPIQCLAIAFSDDDDAAPHIEQWAATTRLDLWREMHRAADCAAQLMPFVPRGRRCFDAYEQLEKAMRAFRQLYAPCSRGQRTMLKPECTNAPALASLCCAAAAVARRPQARLFALQALCNMLSIAGSHPLTRDEAVAAAAAVRACLEEPPPDVSLLVTMLRVEGHMAVLARLGVAHFLVPPLMRRLPADRVDARLLAALCVSRLAARHENAALGVYEADAHVQTLLMIELNQGAMGAALRGDPAFGRRFMLRVEATDDLAAGTAQRRRRLQRRLQQQQQQAGAGGQTPAEEEEGDECPICLEPEGARRGVDGSRVDLVELTCVPRGSGAAVHRVCSLCWVSLREPRCPLCRCECQAR